MNHTLLCPTAILFYLAATALIGLRLFRRRMPGCPSRILALWLGFAGLILHTWLLWDSIFSQPGLNLGFFNALALTSWTVITLLLVSSLTKPVENLGLILLPVAALTLVLEVSFRRGRPSCARPRAGDSRSTSCSPCSPTAC